MRQTGHVVHLAVLDGNEAVIIDRAEPLASSAGADWVGRRLDMHCTSVGKTLVASLPDEKFEQIIRAKRFARHNDNTIVSVGALKKELARVREQGYALDDEEDELGVRCVGVPVFDGNHQVVAAMSVAGAVECIPLERIQNLVDMLNQAASDVSVQLRSHRADSFRAPDSPARPSDDMLARKACP